MSNMLKVYRCQIEHCVLHALYLTHFIPNLISKLSRKTLSSKSQTLSVSKLAFNPDLTDCRAQRVCYICLSTEAAFTECDSHETFLHFCTNSVPP